MIRPSKTIIAFGAWLLLSTGVGLYYGFIFKEADDKSAILPGKTTHGHYQIELACSECHDQELAENIFTSSGVSNESCNKCHGEDLEDAQDSHPTKKFKNPENYIFLQHIDALQCITCHREHDAKVTGEMGTTIPADYCAHCHEMTLENLDSHKDLPFNTCATTGCHNYHDNQALAPTYLLKHYAEPTNLPSQTISPTTPLLNWLADGNKARAPLSPQQADAPPEKSKKQEILDSWQHSSHAAAGINCSECHGGAETQKAWVDQPDHTSCSSCHSYEVETFLKGKHGMRLAAGLSPMTPGTARSPMKKDAAHASLSCSSCHDSHSVDRQFASQQACIQCHDDDHTKNYAGSPHAKLWENELAGISPIGSGVSCATCHLPATSQGDGFAANHNQNQNLTPNEKMLKDTCMQCHGMQFSMDSLADRDLITANFSAPPSKHHGGIDMAVESAISRGDENIIKLREYLDSLSENPKPKDKQ
ncbi:cytochrome c3 family protein [Luteolibacter sp. AS25]|uniref:cytochrome c3 family protein n=1 Tax=Luteolibacter sp. AS25 TaxID=3135776 RepID=UPI00398B87D1